MTPDTVLLRQAHPNFMEGDLPTSQVFYPFPKDENKLSVYDGDQTSAEESHHHYTTVLGNSSHSVWGIAHGEAESADTTPRPDPLENFPEHALIDFGEMNEKQCRKVAKKLKTLAMTRGCLFAVNAS